MFREPLAGRGHRGKVKDTIITSATWNIVNSYIYFVLAQQSYSAHNPGEGQFKRHFWRYLNISFTASQINLKSFFISLGLQNKLLDQSYFK